MAKIFGGDVNFGFVINQTGAQPLDSRSVVKNYTELLKAETFGTALYNGMTVALVEEQKVYMLVDKTKATVAEGWKEVGAGGEDIEKLQETIGDANSGLVKEVGLKANATDLDALEEKVDGDIKNLTDHLTDYATALGEVDDRLDALEAFEETHSSIADSDIESLFAEKETEE